MADTLYTRYFDLPSATTWAAIDETGGSLIDPRA